MTLPQHRVEIAFTTDPLDALPAWQDITESVLSVGIRRGRSHELEEFRAGEATFLLIDEDCACEEGVHTCGCLFNPITNPNMKPRKRIRVLADHADFERTALVFSGNATDRASRAAFSSWPTTALTFEAWVTGTDAAAGDNSEETLVSYFATNRQFVVKDLGSLKVRINNVEVDTGVDVLRGDDFAKFVAVSWRSSDGLLRVYVDGVMRFETIHQQGATLNTGGTFVLGQEQTSLGGGFSTTTALKGTMRDVRLWSIARTHHAIHAGVHRTYTPPVTGLLSYWLVDEGAGATLDDETATGNDLTITGATWGTQTWRSQRFDGFIESFGNVYDDSTVRTVNIKAVDALGLIGQFRELRSPYRHTVLEQGPELYWPLDDGGAVAKDLSGNGFIGTYRGVVETGVAAPFPLGDSGRGVRLVTAGVFSNGVFEESAVAGNYERTDSFSASLLFRWAGDPLTGGTVFALGKNAGVATPRWELSFVQIGFKVNMQGSAGQSLNVDGLRQLLDGHWHHIAFTYAGTSVPSGLSFYADGELLGQSTNFTSTLASSILNAGAFRLVAGGTQATYEATHLALFERALSATEIRAQYEAAFNPWASDRSDVRAERYLDELAWPFRDMWRGVSTISPAASVLGNALRASQDLSVAERSGFYATERGDLALDDRYVNSFEAPTLDEFGGDELGFTVLEPSFVDLDVGTEVHADAVDTPAGPSIASSVSAESTYAPIVVTIGATWSDDDQARDVADRVLTRLISQPVRIARIRPTGEACIDCENERTWGRLLSLRIHRDVVRVFRDLDPPCEGADPLDQLCWVEGMEETYKGCELDSMSWTLVQADPDAGALFLVGRSALNSGDDLA